MVFFFSGKRKEIDGLRPSVWVEEGPMMMKKLESKWRKYLTFVARKCRETVLFPQKNRHCEKTQNSTLLRWGAEGEERRNTRGRKRKKNGRMREIVVVFFPRPPFFDFLPLPPHPSVSHMRGKNPPLFFAWAISIIPFLTPPKKRKSPRWERGRGGIFSIRKFGKWLLRRSAVFFGFFPGEIHLVLRGGEGKKASQEIFLQFFFCFVQQDQASTFSGESVYEGNGSKGGFANELTTPNLPEKKFH